jgi:hypothetical protein
LLCIKNLIWMSWSRKNLQHFTANCFLHALEAPVFYRSLNYFIRKRRIKKGKLDCPIALIAVKYLNCFFLLIYKNALSWIDHFTPIPGRSSGLVSPWNDHCGHEAHDHDTFDKLSFFSNFSFLFYLIYIYNFIYVFMFWLTIYITIIYSEYIYIYNYIHIFWIEDCN